MNIALQNTIQQFAVENLTKERKKILQPLINYIQNKINNKLSIRLNFICTHNSRRSHLSQIWAQTMAFYLKINAVFCYSGGTETTEIFPKIIETLAKQGFEIEQLCENKNPIYSVKYDNNEPPIICFSKTFDTAFNPTESFCAIMTCSSANENCPYIIGAENRISIQYEDPKLYDNTELMNAKYLEKSLEIGQEMFYVFSNLHLQ